MGGTTRAKEQMRDTWAGQYEVYRLCIRCSQGASCVLASGTAQPRRARGVICSATYAHTSILLIDRQGQWGGTARRKITAKRAR